MIVLVGRCGLERLAGALRARGHAVATLGAADPAAVAALSPELVYADVVDRDWMHRAWTAGLRGAPPPDLAYARAALAALAPFPLVVRGVRRPPPAAAGLEGLPPAVAAAWQQAEALVTEVRTVDVQGLWARHGIVDDGVRFGVGHGEAELGPLGESRLGAGDAAAVEAAALEAWLAARRGALVKGVVVDLDGTLVHGELAAPDFGEVNPAWSAAAPVDDDTAWWRAPRGLHDALRVCRARGLALALCTRNDPALVRARFRARPGLRGQVLDVDDFDVVEAGFGPKSAACLRIADRLGVRPDALAFVDDHPVEREEVAANAPGVRGLGPPGPALREVLLTGAGFVPWARTEAAARRPGSWRSRAAAAEAEGAGEAALEAFLHGLELRLTVRAARPADAARVAELIARTHQLRLTGRDTIPPDARVYVAELVDRLADHGLVGVGWFAGEGPTRRLGELAVSCRVLPHRVADAILARMWALEPGARVERVDTGHNAASVGLVDAARRGGGPWVR